MVDEQLVNRLLELARKAEEKAFKVTFSKIRVDEVLWQAKASIQQKTPVMLRIHYDKIPDNEEQLKRFGDESLLRTAFLNLMDNACKYSARQGL